MSRNRKLLKTADRRSFGGASSPPNDIREKGPARRGYRVPVLWLKNLAGVFLLPVAWIWTLSFFGLLAKETVHNRFWITEEFWFFGLGTVLWLIWFAGSLYFSGEPRPIRVYVFGHELTHAIWAWLCGGFVADFKVGREGGHILTNKANFWVTLAPYFYPVYSLMLMVVFCVARLFYDFSEDWTAYWVTPLQGLMLLLGASWSFHFSFTIWMICRGQSDLRMHGNFFSIVLIYIMNVVLLALHLVLALPKSGFRLFGLELLRHTENFSEAVWSLVVELVRRT